MFPIPIRDESATYIFVADVELIAADNVPPVTVWLLYPHVPVIATVLCHVNPPPK